MSSRAQAASSQSAPQQSGPQRSGTNPAVRRGAPGRGMAVIASLLVIVGSFLPWVHTALGNVSGINGPGMWTAYAAFAGLAGAMMPWRRVGAVHLGVFAAVALVLPTWQVVHVLDLVGIGGWLPGTGLVLVACGGILAATAAMRSWRGY